jgi:hypothetical protein
MSKDLPGSIPIRRIRAMIGSSVMCGGWIFISSAAYAKYLPADMVSTCVIGGLFMSTVESIVAGTGWGALPSCDRGVIV